MSSEEHVSSSRASPNRCGVSSFILKFYIPLIAFDLLTCVEHFLYCRRDMPWWLYHPNKIFSLLMVSLQKTPEAGAYTSVYCAITDTNKMDNEGCCYFVNSVPQQLDKCALNKKNAKDLWDLSSQLVSRQ